MLAPPSELGIAHATTGHKFLVVAGCEDRFDHVGSCKLPKGTIPTFKSEEMDNFAKSIPKHQVERAVVTESE